MKSNLRLKSKRAVVVWLCLGSSVMVNILSDILGIFFLESVLQFWLFVNYLKFSPLLVSEGKDMHTFTTH